MHLAALLDLGVPLPAVESELAKLRLSGEYQLEAQPAVKMGISGTQLRVHAKDQHDHRHYSTIRSAIEDAGLTEGATRRALAMFELIAVAEARIHAIDVEKVHFHEVGAIDSIVDIVGAAIALDHLAVERIVSNPVEVGSGTVRCAHGEFPVPAPATQEILTGVPCLYGGVKGESTTPTGAAILKANVDEFAPTASFAPEQFGYGIGHKDFAVSNVLRVVLGQSGATTQAGTESMCRIEANIDDMTAEALAPLLDDLIAAGANDAWCTPIIMKKGRAATMLTALTSTANRDAIADKILNETTTIGVRLVPLQRRALPRESTLVETSLGAAAVKVVTQPDGRQRFKVEHDDVLRIARERGADYLATHRQLDFEVAQHLQP